MPKPSQSDVVGLVLHIALVVCLIAIVLFIWFGARGA